MDHKAPVVIDDGSGYCKGGFAGDDAPRTIFPSMVGVPKFPLGGMHQKFDYFGEQIGKNKVILDIKHPIERGVVVNWMYLEKIWSHCYSQQLHINPEEHPFMLTVAPGAPKGDRQKMTSIMFESFNVPSLYLGAQPVLALYASGRTTGLVIESGDGVTHAVPVHEGCALLQATERNDLAGRDLTEYMSKLLKQRGFELPIDQQEQSARDIKQRMGEVKLCYDQEMKKSPHSTFKDKEYTLPDGRVINIRDQSLRCPEVLFNPSLINKQLPGLHQIAYQSIIKCDGDLQKVLFQNIVLSGGSTMFLNLDIRLSSELSKIAGAQVKIGIKTPAKRRCFPWIGASMLASLSTFQGKCITKEEFQEIGTQIVHKKC